MAFGDALKTLRVARSLTQDQLASLTGVSKSAISMYENGKRFPDEKTLNLLSNFFQVDMNYLLGKKDNKIVGIVNLSDRPYITLRESALLTSFEKLNDENKDKAFEFIDTLVELQKIQASIKSEQAALEWYKAHKQDLKEDKK